ncbi:RDD family protein [Actinomadura citrea]|uniref:RDD family protein n=1 Tax=Actinomadura citrea TaxID=46158 RepID=UPI002E2AE66F|nr:RDD family protein [Actinomadura citrea]
MAAPLAEPGQRLLARVVDTLVVGVPVVLVVRELVSGHTADVMAPSAVAGCMLLYEAIQLALWGRTLGKRVAGIEVVAATAQEAPEAAPRGAGGADENAGLGDVSALPVSVPGFVPVAAPGPEETAAPPGAEAVGASTRPDVLRCVLRAAVYSVPIGLRPIPVLGLLASIFWVANAGAVFEGVRRQAVHDRLAGTLVVKRPRPESSAF